MYRNSRITLKKCPSVPKLGQLVTRMTKSDIHTTVSNTSVLDLIDTCCSLGVLGESDLNQLDIHRSTLINPSLRFPERKLIELWHRISKSTGVPNIGLLIGQTINPSAKGLLASWVSQTESIGEALEIFRHNISLMNPSEHWELEETNDQCFLSFTLQENKAYPLIAIERSMSAMVSWGRALSTENFPLIEARFSFSAPSYHEQFASIFGKNIHFETSQNCIIFNRKLLRTPTTSGNRFLKSIIEDKAKIALEGLGNDNSITKRVKVTIEHVLKDKNVISIDTVCDELAMSRQTLYRKLKKEGSDYKSLLEEFRKGEAIRQLNTTSKSMEKLSLNLGYKDTSSFYKAFKRWFGLSPKMYINNIKH